MIGTATAVAAIPFERVLPLITQEGAATLLGVEAQSVGLTVGAEPDRALVWMHGGYWYQGEYAFTPHPDGTEISHRIRNISGHPDVAIRLWQHRILRSQQRDLDRWAADLAQRV